MQLPHSSKVEEQPSESESEDTDELEEHRRTFGWRFQGWAEVLLSLLLLLKTISVPECEMGVRYRREGISIREE